MINLPISRARPSRRRPARGGPTLAFTASAAHWVLGHERVRVLLDTFYSYGLHRSLLMLRRPLVLLLLAGASALGSG